MSDDVEKQERASGVRTIKRVIPYLWPDGEVWVKRRVLIAMAALLLSKLIAVYTPIIYRDAVNALSGEGVSDLLLGAVGLTVAYGMARIFTSGFQQLRDGVFAAVAQRALRKLALETFTHIHRLSMRYHITRKTGGLSRIIERGVKGVDFLLRFLLFSVGPLILELLLVAGIFFFLFDVWYLAVVVGTIALYVWFTFTVTEWRVKLRPRCRGLVRLRRLRLEAHDPRPARADEKRGDTDRQESRGADHLIASSMRSKAGHAETKCYTRDAGAALQLA